ncbi:hypothetical protein D3C78_1374680 [compost metagenome]
MYDERTSSTLVAALYRGFVSASRVVAMGLVQLVHHEWNNQRGVSTGNTGGLKTCIVGLNGFPRVQIVLGRGEKC